MSALLPVVVDASVGAKWVLTTEHYAPQAAAIVLDCQRSGGVFIVPPHLRGEVANALYQRWRSQDPARHLSADEAERALTDLLAVPLTVLEPPGLYAAALKFAQEYALPSLSDSLYVVLAQQLQGELWTADQRLLAAVGARVPWVRSLADYALG